MKRLQFIIPMLACCLTLPCLSFTDMKDSYLALQVDTTRKYERYSYVNEKGEAVVPNDRCLLCYTDTIRTIGFVLKPNVGCVAISTRGQELFNVYVMDNGNDYPVNGLFRILDKSGQKIGVVNMEGKVIVNPKYDAIFPCHNGLTAVTVGSKTMRLANDPEHEYTVRGKWGFIDKQGNKVIPLEYDSIANYCRFVNSKAPVLKHGKRIELSIRQRKRQRVLTTDCLGNCERTPLTLPLPSKFPKDYKLRELHESLSKRIRVIRAIRSRSIFVVLTIKFKAQSSMLKGGSYSTV